MGGMPGAAGAGGAAQQNPYAGMMGGMDPAMMQAMMGGGAAGAGAGAASTDTRPPREKYAD